MESKNPFTPPTEHDFGFRRLSTQNQQNVQARFGTFGQINDTKIWYTERKSSAISDFDKI
jgi:hypothetical protein